jgi:hypothetical protein
VPYSASIDPILAVEEDSAEKLTLSPNPSTDEAVLELSSAFRGVVTLRLTDAAGREVRALQANKTGESFRQAVNLRNLPTGLYLLRVQQGEQTAVKKLLKQ